MANIVQFEFEGDILDVAKQQDGTLWVSVKRVCEGLGLAYQSQWAKLSNVAACPWATVTKIMTVGGDGRNREMYMLDVECLPMWLATIKPTKVREEVREKLRKYQVEAARVLKAHFLGPRRTLTRSEQLLEMVKAQVRQERLARRARKLALLAERKADESRQLAERAEDLARTAIDIHSGNHGMYSILAFARLHGLPMDVKVASRHGKSLSRLCRDQGEPIGSVRDPRFGQVNTYPEKVLNDYFSAHTEDN